MFRFMQGFIDGLHDDQVTKDVEIFDSLSAKPAENKDAQRNKLFLLQNGGLDSEGFDDDLDPILNSGRARPNQYEQAYLEEYDGSNKNRGINPFLINKLNRRYYLNMIANRNKDQEVSVKSSTKLNLLDDFLELNNRHEYENDQQAFSSDTKINAFGGLSLWQLTAIVLSILMFIGTVFHLHLELAWPGS